VKTLKGIARRSNLSVIGTFSSQARCTYGTDRPALASQDEIRTQKDRTSPRARSFCTDYVALIMPREATGPGTGLGLSKA